MPSAGTAMLCDEPPCRFCIAASAFFCVLTSAPVSGRPWPFFAPFFAPSAEVEPFFDSLEPFTDFFAIAVNVECREKPNERRADALAKANATSKLVGASATRKRFRWTGAHRDLCPRPLSSHRCVMFFVSALHRLALSRSGSRRRCSTRRGRRLLGAHPRPEAAEAGGAVTLGRASRRGASASAAAADLGGGERLGLGAAAAADAFCRLCSPAAGAAPAAPPPSRPDAACPSARFASPSCAAGGAQSCQLERRERARVLGADHVPKHLKGEEAEDEEGQVGWWAGGRMRTLISVLLLERS